MRKIKYLLALAALLLCGALLVGRGFQRRVLREGDGDRLVEREHPPGLLRGRRRRDRRRRHILAHGRHE